MPGRREQTCAIRAPRNEEVESSLVDWVEARNVRVLKNQSGRSEAKSTTALSLLFFDAGRRAQSSGSF